MSRLDYDKAYASLSFDDEDDSGPLFVNMMVNEIHCEKIIWCFFLMKKKNVVNVDTVCTQNCF